MDDLREEIGMQFSLTGRILRNQMMWAGHLVQMEEGRLPRRAEMVKQPGHRKITTKMGGLCKEGCKKDRGGR